MSRFRVPAAVSALFVLALAACGESPVEPVAPELARGGPNQLPTSNGRIYFHGYMTGNYDLYSVNPDGTDLRRLTFGTDDETLPAISPDGKQIAYLKRVGQKREIWMMNADGSRPRFRLAQPTDAVNLYSPVWSPDGRTLTFSYQEDGTLAMRIATIGAKNGAPVVQGAIGWKPAWSPDGAYLAYEKFTPNGPRLVTSRPDGTDLVERQTEFGGECTRPRRI